MLLLTDLFACFPFVRLYMCPYTVESDLISKLVPHVARLVLVDPSFAGRADSVPYRVISSLASLLPPPPSPAQQVPVPVSS